MFMSAVVLETAVSTATCYYYRRAIRRIFRVLPCVIAAPVYNAVFFRVSLALIMIALFPNLDPDPGSNLAHNIECSARGKCSMNT